MVGPLSQMLKAAQAPSDRQLRDEIKWFMDSNAGFIGSYNLAEELKPGAQVLIKINGEPTRQPIELADLVALDSFACVLEKWLRENKPVNLPPKTINEFKEKIHPSVVSRINVSQETRALETVKKFGREFAQSARDVREMLVAKGGSVTGVEHCIQDIDDYMDAIGSLVTGVQADADYNPQMDKFLAEAANPASKLHYRNGVFSTARKILQAYLNEPFRDKDVWPTIDQAERLTRQASLVQAEIMLMNNGKQRK